MIIALILGSGLFVFLLTEVIKKYLLQPFRKPYSLIRILVYLWFGPLFYSTFIIGCFEVLHLASMPGAFMDGLLYILYFVSGTFFAVLPCQSLKPSLKRTLIGYLLPFLVGALINTLNLAWNSRLSQSLGVPLPSIGTFLLFSYGTASATILLTRLIKRFRRSHVSAEREG